MVGAQVALNYGLFCREIVFLGPVRRARSRFLAEMAENTACEIYVNKILKPNPLLTEAARVPTVRQASYLQARADLCRTTRYRGHAASGVANSRSGQRWKTSRNRVAVLSSGGKESLLSYGLLRELGYETHSLFVNESGRHWYTALNGYRHLDGTDPAGTARIWTNADRVFNWMLRRLSLVRPDFQRIRADEYPIRLWTVAVFVFGALARDCASGASRGS